MLHLHLNETVVSAVSEALPRYFIEIFVSAALEMSNRLPYLRGIRRVNSLAFVASLSSTSQGFCLYS